MSSLNDLAYAALGGPPPSLQDLLSEFAETNSLYGNSDEDAFLTAAGYPRSAGSLNDRWYAYWENYTPPVEIEFPDLTLNVGNNGANIHGFVWGDFGSINPDQTTRGDNIVRITCNNLQGNFRFRVNGIYAQNAFARMEIVGIGDLFAADAVYSNPMGDTLFYWPNTGLALPDATVLAVNFT